MMNPTPLLGALKFAVVGRSQIAGRATITADASPRPYGPAGFASLYELGWGADQYILEVDALRGVLLQVRALRDGEDFQRTTTTDITFDAPIPEELFRFETPVGEPIQGVGAPTAAESLSLSETQQRAPFTIMVLQELPATWRVRCLFLAGGGEPASPPQVSVLYRSNDGHQSLSLSQCSIADSMPEHKQVMADQRWETIVLHGRSVRLPKAHSTGGQSRAHVQHLGTSVFLTSDTIARKDLASVAARLRPLDVTSVV